MNSIYHDLNGLIHLSSAVLALITGTWILVAKKGTQQHRVVGYIYFSSMLILNITAFMIYRLFGGFGIFHIAAIISLVTVLAGMYPVIKKPENWVLIHFAWMYWSVIGLYAAFISETLTRIPSTPFFGMVGIGTTIIMIAGTIYYRRQKINWSNQFKHFKS